MKKLFILLLLPLFFCSCRQKPQEYLITAIGADYDGGLYTLYFEAVIANTEEEGQKREIITAKGRTLLETVENIEKQATLPLLTSHCGVVAVGKGITRTKLLGIMRYCKENRDIPLSIQFIKTDNPEKLLKTEPISSISVGYDLVSIMQKSNKKLSNRLFEIYKSQSPVLPKLTLTEKGYYFD
ncbi:MAG: hypothetical protein J6B80_07990 [Clostridia bacterium]|nr:hypothetical protein [Clostridia bacterium]